MRQDADSSDGALGVTRTSLRRARLRLAHGYVARAGLVVLAATAETARRASMRSADHAMNECFHE